MYLIVFSFGAGCVLLSLKSIEHTCLVSRGGERRRCFWATAVQSEAVRMWRMDVRSSLTPESVTVKAVGYHHHTAQFPLEIKTPLEGPRVHSGRFSHKQNQRHIFKSISMLSTANACVRVTGEGYNRYFTASSVTGLFFFLIIQSTSLRYTNHQKLYWFYSFTVCTSLGNTSRVIMKRRQC